MRAVLIYTVARVLVFVVPFAILMLIGFDWWWAALIAAVVGFCLSYLALKPLRDRVALQIATARSAPAPRGADELAEDAD
ncbi:MAG: DUF4229 domain-containing protein [Pseudolysinimonas sp.]|uniref:DUF4229 domain-containing protein n=1 Tax=Pseudolysinimonas sp. TaxID=2680009 RepID=UPI0032675EBE